MNRLNLIMMALALVLSAKAEVKTLKVKVANPSSVERTAVPVVVPIAEQYSTALTRKFLASLMISMTMESMMNYHSSPI